LLYVLEFIVRAVLTPEVQKITRMDVKGVAMVFAGCVMVSPSTDMATMMYSCPSPCVVGVVVVVVVGSGTREYRLPEH
jgi:hypothetical protein